MDIARPFEVEDDFGFDYLGGNAITIERSTEFAQLVAEYDAAHVRIPEIVRDIHVGKVAIQQPSGVERMQDV